MLPLAHPMRIRRHPIQADANEIIEAHAWDSLRMAH